MLLKAETEYAGENENGRAENMKAKRQKTAFLAAGGTGGHVFPAEALGIALQARGWNVHIVTDSRARRFITAAEEAAQKQNGFAADKIHVLSSATLVSKNPLRLARSLALLLKGFWQSLRLYRRFRPHIVIGFGGYPTVPPLLAAFMLHIPALIHEQNAVMGRANRLLAHRAARIACGFPPVKAGGAFAAKTVITGNPLRPAVLAVCNASYQPADKKSVFRLLVFGGSQGARFFAEIMPQSAALLPQHLRARLRIIQQARAADEAELRAAYADLGIKAEIAVFFKELPALMAEAHFIIARAGASTVAEIAALGRPALLIPYPDALDHDQRYNARGLAAHGAEIMEQSAASPKRLADLLTHILENPQNLQQKAQNIARQGKKNATEELAALTEKYAAPLQNNE